MSEVASSVSLSSIAWQLCEPDFTLLAEESSLLLSKDSTVNTLREARRVSLGGWVYACWGMLTMGAGFLKAMYYGLINGRKNLRKEAKNSFVSE